MRPAHRINRAIATSVRTDTTVDLPFDAELVAQLEGRAEQCTTDDAGATYSGSVPLMRGDQARWIHPLAIGRWSVPLATGRWSVRIIRRASVAPAKS
jgi:hypothetical protein